MLGARAKRLHGYDKFAGSADMRMLESRAAGLELLGAVLWE